MRFPLTSTNPFTAKKSRLQLREDKSVTNVCSWLFTDGSSSGWHAAIAVERHLRLKGYMSVLRRAAFLEPDSTRNVGAELDAMILGLTFVRAGGKVIVVHDYLGVGAWMVGLWNIKNPLVKVRIDKAKNLVMERQLHLQFVHHSGHQTDDSHFTHWNSAADALCSAKQAVIKTSRWQLRRPT